MANATGFGIEAEELRTIAIVFLTAVPAVALLGLAKDTRQRVIAVALGSAMLIGASVLNVKMLTRE